EQHFEKNATAVLLIGKLPGRTGRPDLHALRWLDQQGTDAGGHRPAGRPFHAPARVQATSVYDQDLLPGRAPSQMFVKPGQRNKRIFDFELPFQGNEICFSLELDYMTEEQKQNAVLRSTVIEKLANGFFDNRLEGQPGGRWRCRRSALTLGRFPRRRLEA